MSPLVYVVFALVVIVALLTLGYLHLLDKLDGGDHYQPTARQRRQWHRDRADLNPAFRGRR